MAGLLNRKTLHTKLEENTVGSKLESNEITMASIKAINKFLHATDVKLE